MIGLISTSSNASPVGNGISPTTYLVGLLITSAAGIIAAIGIIVNNSRQKKIETKQKAIEATVTSANANIGVANGHGPLMDQMTVILKQNTQMTDHLYEMNSKLENHILESAEYRFRVRGELSTIRTDLDEITREVHDKFPKIETVITKVLPVEEELP